MWCYPHLERKLMVAGGKKKGKKKRKEKKTVQKKTGLGGSPGNSAVVPALELVRKSVRYRKQKKRKRKTRL